MGQRLKMNSEYQLETRDDIERQQMQSTQRKVKNYF